MKREEAIEHLKEWREVISIGHRKAVIDMAIEALQRETDLLKRLETNEPLYDMVDVVRCKDCTNFDYAFNYCDFLETGVEGEDFFCAYGERKGGGDE